MTLKLLTTISMVALLAACGGGGSGGGNTGGGNTGGGDTGGGDTGGGETGSCEVAVDQTPCIVGRGQNISIEGTDYTSSITGNNGNSIIYNQVTDADGYVITPTGSIAGTSQVVFGNNNMSNNSIFGVSSDLQISTDIQSIGNVTFNGNYAQTKYSDTGASKGFNTGSATMVVDANAGTMTLSGDDNFAAAGEVLNWDNTSNEGSFSNEGSENDTFFAGGGVFGGTEAVGYYEGEFEDLYVTGTYGGVAN